jgi:hypothetical protein
MICEQVDVEDINRPTLAVLARTAKIFQYSLDLLWREQHNLLPLLKCMPLDLWETEECADQPEVFFVRAFPDDACAGTIIWVSELAAASSSL